MRVDVRTCVARIWASYSDSLEAAHDAFAQRLERVPFFRTDGPRHLGVIRNDCKCVYVHKNDQYPLAHVLAFFFFSTQRARSRHGVEANGCIEGREGYEPFGVQSRPEITPCTRCSGRICCRSAEMPAYATKAASSAFTPSQGAYPAWALPPACQCGGPGEREPSEGSERTVVRNIPP